jgi:hypothetical protein
MPGPIAQGTFANTNPANNNQTTRGDVLCVPTGMTTMRLTTVGVDASNTIKTQKRTAGGAFVDQTTYSTEQTNTAITVATGEEWCVVAVTQQVTKDVRYKLSCEN